MDFILTLSQALSQTLATAYVIFTHGGWILAVLVIARMSYNLYMKKIQGDWIDSNKQIFLHIKVGKDNEKSIRAIDALFSQLHAIQTNFTWAETYLEGRVDLWVSFEIVSIGGKISYIVRIPEKFRHLLEASFYAHYPNAEIALVEDYMSNLKHWTPESDWDLWGTEYKFTRDFPYPIRTYKDFEHMASEEKIIDPLAGMLESLSKIEAHELFGLQIVVRPIPDGWQDHSKELVQQLKGEEIHKEGLIDIIMKPLNILGKKSFLTMLTEKREVKHEDEHGGNIAPVMRLSEGERRIISAIEEKAAKPGYEVKIRTLYIAPKGRMDLGKRTGVIGAFRSMGGQATNDIKPDVKHTWTNYNYMAFKNLEKPFVDYMIAHKKHHLLEGYWKRSMWIGAQPMIMSTEELATIFHFPLIGVQTPPVQAIDVKKGQPPADLPIL